MNEPQIVGLFTYMHGYDNDDPEPCQVTKLCTQAYTVVHNYILCHAAAVKLYREKFQVEYLMWLLLCVTLPQNICIV